MENTAYSQLEKNLDDVSLFFASVILLETSRTVRTVQTLVTVLLRYVGIGVSISNYIIGLFLHESPQLE